MTTNLQDRGAWGSRFGFIMAAAGSAIGLGNIWRFPYVTGQNGGAIFVLFYLFFILLIGLPVMIGEFSIGRFSRKNPVGAFKLIAPRSGWKYLGLLGILTGISILSFYAVIAGYTVGYIFKAVRGDFAQLGSAEAASSAYEAFSASPELSIGLLFAFLAITGFIVIRGVRGGIEKMAKLLMPILFLLLIILAIRSVTLEGAGKGLEFYLKPDFSKVTSSSILTALGQALFSLSLGMGTMITYGSYLSKNEDIGKSAIIVCFFDTLVAILAGFVILPALFALGADPEAGPRLIFVVIPSLLNNMPGGAVFGIGFFTLLSIAALTSTVSLLEVPVAYFVDEWKWNRKKSVIISIGITFMLGIPSALAGGAVGFLTSLPKLGIDFLSFMSIVFNDFSLSIGACMVALFAAYRWGIKNTVGEIEREGVKFTYKAIWTFLIRFITPILIAAVFIQVIYQTFFS